MAAFDFPNSPNTNDTYTANGMTFIWNGSVWKKDPSAGTKGEKGQKGEVGQKGDVGPKGQKGEDNSTKGQKGETGAVAAKGDKGSKGQKGEVGATGGSGDAGSQGIKGQKGEIGDKGSLGGPGSEGIKGQKGEVGAAGSTGIPSGLIAIWKGASNLIGSNASGGTGSGWVLCDGSNGTPDLRDRFVVGAGSGYSVGSTGGATSVTLSTANLPSHTHGAGSYSAASAGGHTHTFDAHFSSTSLDNDEGNATIYPNLSQRSTDSAGSHTHSVSGTSGATGSGNSFDNRPPYYALCYIMKT